MECVVSGMSGSEGRGSVHKQILVFLSQLKTMTMTEKDSLRPDDEGNKGQPWIMDAPAQYMNLR